MGSFQRKTSGPSAARGLRPFPPRFPISLLVCLALLLSPCLRSSAHAAISANGSFSSTANANTTSLTWPYTVNSGGNRVLCVELSIDGLGASVSGVSYGGVPLAIVGRGTGNHAVEAEACSGVTDAATTPVNTLGRSKVALDPSDLNLSLTECSSPAINAGIDLGCDQPDMNGSAAALWNNNAPDLGAFESSASCAATLNIVKQACGSSGSAPLTTLTAPVGSSIVFLIYVKSSTGGPVGDLRINDVLDETAFQYQAGSLVVPAPSPRPRTAPVALPFSLPRTRHRDGAQRRGGRRRGVGPRHRRGAGPGPDHHRRRGRPGQCPLADHTSFGLRFKVKIK